MKKHTYMIEMLDDRDIDEQTVAGLLKNAIDGIATYDCVTYNGAKYMTEQGKKVWAKRKCGISLAQPKPVKAAKPTETAETESEELVGVEA